MRGAGLSIRSRAIRCAAADSVEQASERLRRRAGLDSRSGSRSDGERGRRDRSRSGSWQSGGRIGSFRRADVQTTRQLRCEGGRRAAIRLRNGLAEIVSQTGSLLQLRPCALAHTLLRPIDDSPRHGDVRAQDLRRGRLRSGQTVRRSWAGSTDISRTIPSTVVAAVLRRAQVSARPAPRTALDLGCGPGQLARTLAGMKDGSSGQPLFARVRGVDPSAGMVETARSIEPHTAVDYAIGTAEDAEAWAEPTEFDLIVCVQAACVSLRSSLA